MSEDVSARLGRSTIYRGRIVHLTRDRVRFPDGSEGNLELVRHRGAAAVLPVLGSERDPDPDILLLHQYRYAAGGDMWEIPAGVVEEGETWEECAHRELEEEAGVKAGWMVGLTMIHTTPGFTNEQVYIYAGLELIPGTPQADEDEFLEVVRMPLSKALRMVRGGELSDAKTMIALLYTERFLTSEVRDQRDVGQ